MRKFTMLYLKGLFKSLFFLLIGLFFTCLAFADTSPPQDEPFSFHVGVAPTGLIFSWQIKPGNFLYLDKVHISALPPTVYKREIILPTKGQTIEHFGHINRAVYEGTVNVFVGLDHTLLEKSNWLVTYQGCSKKEFCYSPFRKNVKVLSHRIEIRNISPNELTIPLLEDLKVPALSEQAKAANLLKKHNLGSVLLSFLGFGLLLSLTPCVLPMVPILSSIIVGQKTITTQKAFFLSLTYVLAMALTYAVAGIFAGLAGSYLQAFLQNPWVVVATSVLFILLGFSLLGLYELKIPQIFQEKLVNISNRQRAGTYIGIAMMGVISTLILSPCITAPLVGALTYIGKTGDAFLGGLALFALGIGSGMPLLIIGTSAGRLMLKTGKWTNLIKIVLGILMLCVACWLLARAFPTRPPFSWIQQKDVKNAIHFYKIGTLEDFQTQLLLARKDGKPLLADFYASWCSSCNEMEATTFKDEQVQQLLRQFRLIRVDVSANNEAQRLLEKKLNVIAPPTFIFYKPSGEEVEGSRQVGLLSTPNFISHVEQFLKAMKVE